jgi:hypothetical protein
MYSTVNADIIEQRAANSANVSSHGGIIAYASRGSVQQKLSSSEPPMV